MRGDGEVIQQNDLKSDRQLQQEFQSTLIKVGIMF